MSRLAALLLSLLAAGIAHEPVFAEHRAVMELLASVHPRFREYWLESRGHDPTEFLPPYSATSESTGLRLVGKYGRGPSVAVTGRDTLVALTLGSEVALVSFANPDAQRVLSEIQVNFLPGMSILHGTYILIGGNGGIEVWDIADPAQPVFRQVIPYAVGGFAVWDTFLYFVSRDTFHVYSIASPADPYRIGFLPVSGNVGAATQSTVVMRQPGDLLGFIDVTDPAHPRLAGTYPGFALAFAARNTICCAAMYWSTDEDHFRFEVLDISDPANVRRIAALDSIGAYDIHLSGPFAFLSGHQNPKWEFTILNLSDSTHPQVISSCRTPGDNYGVWADWTRDWAYVADMVGLAVIDVANPGIPRLDTVVLKAMLAQDVWVDGTRAYVADDAAGMRILDVSVPSLPVELGGIDSTRNMVTNSVAARDSFAFMGWAPASPYLRSISVADPVHPTKVGGASVFDFPQDMVLRDSLLYVAQAYRFQVLNVARPRNPVLVGSCVLSGDVGKMVMADSLAYVTSSYFTTVSVARPDSPRVVHEWGSRAVGIDVADTVLYMAYYGLKTASIADPSSPYVLDSLYLHDIISDVVVVDSLAVVGGWDVNIVDVSDPRDIRLVGTWTPPSWVHRLLYVPPHIYACCYDGGVAILETTLTGVAEPPVRQVIAGPLRVRPTIVAGRARFFVTAPLHCTELGVYDATGTKLTDACVRRDGASDAQAEFAVDLAAQPDGVYVVRAESEGRSFTAKVVKTRRR